MKKVDLKTLGQAFRSKQEICNCLPNITNSIESQSEWPGGCLEQRSCPVFPMRRT